MRGLNSNIGGGGKYPYERAQPDQPPYQVGKTKTRSFVGVIFVGLLLILFGLVISAVPLLMGNMRAIADDWEGTQDEGYYVSYTEGERAIVAGEITRKYMLDSLNDTELWGMGYRYCYELDNVWEECPIAKEDIGEVGDRVMMTIRLRAFTVDGDPTWFWTVASGGKEDNVPFYVIGAVFLLAGTLLIIFGLVRRSRAMRPQPRPSRTHLRPQVRSSMSRGAPESTSLGSRNLCKHCYSEMPLGEMICPNCGKSKFDSVD